MLSVRFEVGGRESKVDGCGSKHRRPEPLGGPGSMLPQKIFKSTSLEMPFPAFSNMYFPLKGNES